LRMLYSTVANVSEFQSKQ